MSGIGIILNPYSRSNRQNPERIRHMGFIVGDKGSCHATDTIEEVHQLAYEFRQRDIDVLGISGGDGTNHQTLSTFIEVYGEKPLPRIAFLRGGTMNNMAGQLGIYGRPEKVLSNLILKYHEGGAFTETQINMIKVNGKFGFIFGMGLVTKFINIYQEKGATPMLGALLLGRAMFSSVFNLRLARYLCERFDCRLTIDGQPQPFRNYMMIFAGTMRTLGLNFRPLYRATSEPGKFQAVGVSATARQLLWTFPRAFLAMPSRSEHYVDKMTGCVRIELDQPMTYTIDGDMSETPARLIEVETGPVLNCIIS